MLDRRSILPRCRLARRQPRPPTENETALLLLIPRVFQLLADSYTTLKLANRGALNRSDDQGSVIPWLSGNARNADQPATRQSRFAGDDSAGEHRLVIIPRSARLDSYGLTVLARGVRGRYQLAAFAVSRSDPVESPGRALLPPGLPQAGRSEDAISGRDSGT